MNNLSVLKYRDPETCRYRWAVYQYDPAVWYFPKHYGLAAARALLRRLSDANLTRD